jgi:TorA maturation chaperone TorD
MRDPGLQEAIRTVGGVSELARRIGISQPSVSNWDRIPAERVLMIETATGISRAILRPDLFGVDAAGDIDEVDIARAQEYALLAVLLARAPDAGLLARLAELRGDASPLGIAHVALAQAASAITVERIEREYFNLFIGLGRGELLPYGSYYLTGFLHERPLARLREDLRQLGIERAEGQYEPEDHAAILCEIMAGLASGRFGAKNLGAKNLGAKNLGAKNDSKTGAEQLLFEKHLAPWLGRFFADLERAEAADFYRRVGTLGRIFMDIETEAFALPS